VPLGYFLWSLALLWLRAPWPLAACHVVAADQQVGTTQSPAFSTIARKPDFTEAMLALFLLNPHPRMPDMNLSRSEAADLAAYINTQK
jgi:mono/diheme cytochrome c family protein